MSVKTCCVVFLMQISTQSLVLYTAHSLNQTDFLIRFLALFHKESRNDTGLKFCSGEDYGLLVTDGAQLLNQASGRVH